MVDSPAQDNSRTKCNHDDCAGKCYMAPETCLHKNCQKDCLITPEEAAAWKKTTVHESRRYHDNDVRNPSLYAIVQYENRQNETPEQILYGKYLVHKERNDGVALLYIDHYLGNHTREYRRLTLSHQWVNVQTYTFDSEKRDWKISRGEQWMTYSAYLAKKKKHPNWRTVVVDMRDRLGRDGHDEFWMRRF
jgi:hypothetical protein